MHLYNLLIKIALLILLGIIVSVLEWIIYRRLLPRFAKKHYVWRTAFLKAQSRPVHAYAWFLIASFIVTAITNHFSLNGDLGDIFTIIRRIVTVLFVFWFAMRFIRQIEQGMVAQARRGKGKITDQTSIYALAQLIRVVAIVIILLILLQTAGIKISALLAFGGAGALVVGLAARESLANFIGGMMIYWDRPFSVGDWICSPDRQIEGTVENIGWRLTCIRTFDKCLLYVPNGILSNISLENPSRMTRRRIKTSVGVRYDDAHQIAAITTDIKQMLADHLEIDDKQTMLVCLNEFAPSSLNILIYTFTHTTEWVKFQEIQQDVFLKIMAIIAAHGAQCAFPTHTVHIPDGIEKYGNADAS